MPISWQIKLLSTVGSTQDIAMLAAQDGDPEGYVVQAMSMTGGRGRNGNQWSAPMGNIYMSALLRPSCDMRRAGELAFVIAVALSDALEHYIDSSKHKITLKWPNDVLIDGLKISGILLETNMKDGKLDGVIAGIGVNIFNAPDLAVSLNNVAKEPIYVNKVRDVILEELNKNYSLWQKNGFPPIREKWLARAYGIGKAITTRLPHESFKGIFEGLNEDGALILRQEDGGQKIIHAADVHFGEDAK